MFAIGDKEWPGLSKVVEEMGELNQVLGKLMGSRGDTRHWSGDLWPLLHNEIADVLAALRFFVAHNKLDNTAIERRAASKLELFNQWHEIEALLADPRGRQTTNPETP